jgi:antitoxin (DNA-binding transcriptional repressor) of toxin-antitoxin stability system
VETVTMLEFRKNTGAVIRKALQGKRMLLTYRGKPVMRLEPIESGNPGKNDPFYALSALADSGGKSLTNNEMDEIIYG